MFRRLFASFFSGMVITVLFISCTSLKNYFDYKKYSGEGSYFVKAGGNDRNNGLSEETAFKSLFKAMAMAANSPIKTITVIGTLDVHSEQSTNRERVFLIQGMGTTPVLIRGKNSDVDPAVLSAAGAGRRAVMVRGTVPIRLENIEISGGVSSTEGGGLGIDSGSTVILGPGAVIRNNQSNSFGGGVVVVSGGSFIIDGGKILDNRSDAVGGGIMAIGQRSTLLINEGEIRGNHAQGGGAIAIFQEGTFILKEGIIHENSAVMAGGAVLLNQNSLFTMEGGLIRGNRSSGSGGGLALMEASAFVLEDGEILGNQAGEHGGGIAADPTGVITINGGYISTNKAANFGGGVFTAGAFLKSAGKIYGSDMPEDAANTASSGAAVYIFLEGDKYKKLEKSAGEDLMLNAALDDVWIIAE